MSLFDIVAKKHRSLPLWLRGSIDDLNQTIRDAQMSLVDFAEANHDIVIPGYTHLQRAQPVLLAHWCLAYFEMLTRDRERATEVRRRVNVLPLGSAALAGTSFPIDREALATALGFEKVSHLKEVGYKQGRWLDVIWMQKML